MIDCERLVGQIAKFIKGMDYEEMALFAAALSTAETEVLSKMADQDATTTHTATLSK